KSCGYAHHRPPSALKTDQRLISQSRQRCVSPGPHRGTRQHTSCSSGPSFHPSLRSPLDTSGSPVGPRCIGGLRLAWGWLSSFSFFIHRNLVYRALDNFEERVIDRRLRLLDTRDVITRGVDTKIHSFGAYHLSAI